MITYSTDKNFMANCETITARRAFEIINMNKRGEKPNSLTDQDTNNKIENPIDLVEQESLTRFDKKKGNNNKKRKKKPSNNKHENMTKAKEQEPNKKSNKNKSSNNSREKQTDKPTANKI